MTFRVTRSWSCRCILCALLALVWPSPGRADALETYGDVARAAIPAIGAIAALAKQDYEGLAQLGLGVGTTVGLTAALKEGFDRKRPNGGGHAFPSGHTSSAFAGAAFLHFRYGWKYGLPAYAAASVVGVSRIEADKHDGWDVAGGAALAILVAYLFTDTLDESVSLIPFADVGKKNFGITARLKF